MIATAQPTLVADTWAGVFPNIPADEYHLRELGVANKSALDHVAKSPAKYLAWINGELEDESTKALEFGSAFHCALLEPDRFALEYAVMPDFGDRRFAGPKAEHAKWEKKYGKRKQISQADMKTILGMIAGIRRRKFSDNLTRGGQSELTLRWIDEESGLRCKARADYYVKEFAMAVDVKSTIDASDEAFARTSSKYGYARQDAHYRAGFAANGLPLEAFVFLAVEKEPPYEPALYVLDDFSRERGELSIRRDLNRLGECIANKIFPGYSEEIRVLRLPY